MYRFLPLLAMAPRVLLAPSTEAGDCDKDDLPLSNDLEPPPPGGNAVLLRVSDQDLRKLLANLEAHERSRKREARVEAQRDTD